MSSKFSDVSSSQSASSRVDMSDSKLKDNPNSTDFDSGVISDAIVSSELSSEVDVEDDKSHLSRSSARASDLSSDKNVERQEMSLDSGIITDLSDQLYSKNECEKPAEAKIPAGHDVPKREPRVITLEMLYAQDEDGDTNLHSAVWDRREEMIKNIVLVTPISELLDIQNDEGQTCLHLAVKGNQPRVTRLLLLAGARINIEDMNGNTPLHLACMMNHGNCLEALLTPVTSFERKYYSFKYIPKIDSPRNYLNEINYDGLSCLHIAAKTGNLRMIHYLLMNGADVNIKEWKGGCTVLHQAVMNDNTELVRYILHHPKIDLETKNYAHHTAYQLSYRNTEILDLLLQKNANRLDFADEIDESDESDSDEYDSCDDDTPDEQFASKLHINSIAEVSC